jgi:hypothetical protein
MKNILLSAVVISAIMVAGVGGTLAGFSDTEISQGNFFEVGSLDLRINELDDPIGPIVTGELVWPDDPDSVYDFTFHSVSEPAGKMAYGYIKFKNASCAEVLTEKHPTGKTEPENVAELGGVLNQEEITGLGELCIADYASIVVTMDMDQDPSTPNDVVYDGPLSDLVADGELWIYLGQFPACQTFDGQIGISFADIPEEVFDVNYFADDLPFNDWPTNLFQLDGFFFDVEFALCQEPIPAAYLWQQPE